MTSLPGLGTAPDRKLGDLHRNQPAPTCPATATSDTPSSSYSPEKNLLATVTPAMMSRWMLYESIEKPRGPTAALVPPTPAVVPSRLMRSK